MSVDISIDYDNARQCTRYIMQYGCDAMVYSTSTDLARYLDVDHVTHSDIIWTHCDGPRRSVSRIMTANK